MFVGENLSDYKKIKISFTGDSQSGKTATIKAMQVIHFMDRIGIPEKERYDFLTSRNPNSNFITKIRERDYHLIDLFDSLCFRIGNQINLVKVEDFLNIPQVKETLEPHPLIKTYLSKDDEEHLRIKYRINELIASNFEIGENSEMQKIKAEFEEKAPTLYDKIAQTCEIILRTGEVTLEDIIMNTSTTITYSMKDIMESKRTLSNNEMVWVNIGGEEALVEINDAGGQDKFKYLRPELYMGIQGGVIFVNLIDRQTLNAVGKFPETIGIPPYDELDQTNLSLVLKILSIANPEEFHTLVSRIPEKFRNNPQEFIRNFAKLENKKIVNTIIENGFPRELYEPIFEKYKSPSTPGWLQEMYNSRWVLKTSEDETIMVPVLVYGNKSDLTDYTQVTDEDIISEIGDKEQLPYIKGSAKTLQNIKQMFQVITLMGLSASRQITPEEYVQKIKEVEGRIEGTYRLGDWAR